MLILLSHPCSPIKHFSLRYRKQNVGNTVSKLKNSDEKTLKEKKKKTAFPPKFYVKEAKIWILAMIYLITQSSDMK